MTMRTPASFGTNGLDDPDVSVVNATAPTPDVEAKNAELLVSDVKRNRWGQYLLPDPTTGEERAWVRATTWASTLSDPFGLNQWRTRMTAKGIATRDDLRALAAATPLDSKKQLNEVARDAIEHAGGSSGRNMGTALHEWTAQADRGEVPEVPQPWNDDIGAYRGTLSLHGIRVIPELVEQIVCIPDLGIAGTFDRIVAWEPLRYIADVKTGADLSYAWQEIAVQLALYANAEYLWDDEAEKWVDMPPVDKTQGLVIHLAAGQAKCELWWVDLELGWMAALLASDVREWRKQKNIARPFGVDLLGRSPVQPVLDLEAGADRPGNPAAPEVLDTPGSPASEDSPAAASATESDGLRDQDGGASVAGDNPEGAAVTAASGAAAPAGDTG